MKFSQLLSSLSIISISSGNEHSPFQEKEFNNQITLELSANHDQYKASLFKGHDIREVVYDTTSIKTVLSRSQYGGRAEIGEKFG